MPFFTTGFDKTIKYYRISLNLKPLHMKKDIFSDTILEEVLNFKGKFIEVPDSSNIPELVEEKVLGKMTTFEKRLFTLAMRRECKAREIIDKVLSRGEKEVSMCDNCKFNTYASKEEKTEHNKLLIESETINIIFYHFIRMRFSDVDSNFVVFPTSGYKIIAGKPKVNWATISSENTLSDFSKGVFGQPIGGEA